MRIVFIFLNLKYLLRLGAVGVLLISLFPFNSVAQAAQAPIPNYTIVANLNVGDGTVNASEKVQYINSTGNTLNSIVFNVTPAFYNAFQLSGAKVEGNNAKTSLNGVVLEVFLPEPLLSGSSVSIDFDFLLKIPRQEGRLGMGNGIIALGNWFPILSVYRNGWDRHQYVDIGDAFFTEVANYNVTLKTSVPVTVAYTGRLIEQNGLQWKMEASNVRDFALAVSDKYLTKSVDVNGVKVIVYYVKGHESGGDVFLRAGAESLSWFSSKFGNYPYPNLQIAEIWSPSWLGTGQEYPNVIFVGSSSASLGGGMGDYLSFLVVHEVAHQWFYGIVGNDQVYAPWLDEAIVTDVSLLFFKDRYPGRFAELWKSRVTDGYYQYKAQRGDRKVNSSIYDYNDELYYFAMVYRKGAIFLDEVMNATGQDQYLSALRKYVQTNWFGIATPQGFFDLMQTETKVDVKQIASRYFDYAFLATPAQANSTPTVLKGTPTSTSVPTATLVALPTSQPMMSPTVTVPPANSLSVTVTPINTPSELIIGNSPVVSDTQAAVSPDAPEENGGFDVRPLFLLPVVLFGFVGFWYLRRTRGF